MEDVQIVVDLVSLAEALWAVGGVVTGVLGTLIFGRRYKERIAALEAESGTTQITLEPGAAYLDFRTMSGGEFHIHLDGKAQIVSKRPVRIVGAATSVSGATAASAQARILPPEDEDQS